MNGESSDQVVCSNCEITLVPAENVYLRCESCHERGLIVNLCVTCFRMGAECGPHKRGHEFIIADRKGPSIFPTTSANCWGWKEDLKLIQAVRKHKLGNWEEIASELCTNKTAEEARKHFDQFFIRGALGRYAAGVISWQLSVFTFRPSIDDHTDKKETSQSDSHLSSGRHAINSSDYQYVTEFFRNWTEPVNLDDPNWFKQFEEPLVKFKREFYSVIPSSSKDIDSALQIVPKTKESSCLKPITISPVSVEFFRVDSQGKQKRLHSMSDFDESENEKATNSDSSNICEDKVDSLSTAVSSNVNPCASSALRNTEGETGPEISYGRKPILRLKRVGRNWRAKNDVNKKISEEISVGKTVIKINEDVKNQLRKIYPEQFYASTSVLPFGAEERSRLKDDDLQLLGYMPEREDFELEFNNDAEKLISRLTLQPGSDKDEDRAFEDAVKLTKVEKYIRVLKQRKAKKAAIREYELVNQFFDKIKKIEETRRSVLYNQQSSSSTCQQERLHSFMKKTCQVATKSELQQLLNAVTGYINLNEKIMNLENLKADGVTDLKGRNKVISDGWKSKRRRRPLHANEVLRKAHLRWERFKRWSMQQAAENGSLESDA
ncbi:unnamed protein product [Thelazia callipaeda]|uniref:SANT domain-containing protein n=1 Tax=Thelazia callipaeda TaxID=103827 RepID=A0A158RBM0_THECL|nr:unnamed protein product [Thelazia callipaeda]